MFVSKYTILILFILLLVFTLNFVVNVNAIQYCPTTITVIDEDTRVPMRGTKVTWSGGELTTNENGQVTFNTILYSNNKITASAEGYETDSIWVYCRSCCDPINEVIYLKRIVQPRYCTLDIYVKDQNGNSIDGNIYVDNSYKGYDDHLTIDIQLGTHKVEVTRDGYYSDSATVTCACTETKRIDLTLRKKEEGVKLRISDFDVNPDTICMGQDETVEMSIRVNLEQGPDNTFVTTKFYVEDDRGNWHYIDRDEKYLDRGQTKTFSVDYHYSAYFSDEGIHDVRAKVETGTIIENVYSELDVKDCIPYRYRVVVGSISLDNEYPDLGDIVLVSTPITLNYARLPETVYVKGYVDDNLVHSASIRFYKLGTETFQFTIDTDKYTTGPHTIKVKAEVDTKTDTSTRTFSISPVGYYVREAEHCLSVEKIWTEEELKPGERNKVYVRVLSCGTKYEKNVKMKLEAFSKTFYTGEFDIPARGSKDVFVTITVPEDVSGKQSFKVTVWNIHTSDTWTKDFEVQVGIPYVEIKPEFILENCQKERITFGVTNTGKVSDTFTISLTGIGAEWVTGVPSTITLDPDERKTVTAYVSVPCDAEEGYYEFTIIAKDSTEYSATSTMRVIRPWRWPIFPTGIFLWLPWILLILLIIFLVFLFGGYWLFTSGRRRPMFDCYDGCMGLR
ncbi:MAG: PEGA domain-containing protein [Candidatus Aenigmarchaeota archaeon]|nr:PEGA domain-containing protein [Candidatus Aenigmarchaeota archaeon]